MWRSFKNHSPVLVQYTKDFDKRESMAKVSILNVIHIYLVDESRFAGNAVGIGLPLQRNHVYYVL